MVAVVPELVLSFLMIGLFMLAVGKSPHLLPSTRRHPPDALTTLAVTMMIMMMMRAYSRPEVVINISFEQYFD